MASTGMSPRHLTSRERAVLDRLLEVKFEDVQRAEIAGRATSGQKGLRLRLPVHVGDTRRDISEFAVKPGT